MTQPRFRAAELFPKVSIDLRERPDGTLLLSSDPVAATVPRSVAAVLVARAAELGEKTFLAARDADGEWERISYARARELADRVAGWFVARRAPAAGREESQRPERVLIVTGNSLAHGILMYGAGAASVPICPVSAQYALAKGGEFTRLRHVIDTLRPTVVFAEVVGPIVETLRAVLPEDITLICTDPQNWPGSVPWAEVVGHEPVADPDAMIAAIDPEQPLRYMLTSGSTGLPKIVIQTNRMWCSLFVGANAVLAEVSGWGVRTLDWMPWSHVAGVSVLTGALVNGGSFYLDEGRPTPELFGATLRNIAEIQPLFFANVPFAFAMLCDALEGDAHLRERFFEHLQLCLFGGAGLPQPVYDRFQAMAEATIGERVMFTTGYGSTETTAGVMSVSWPTTQVGVGLPLPGIEAKLVPLDEERYEVRFRSESVMPGYLDNPEGSARVFDEEGFYRSGDALAFVDRSAPEQGMVFAGRLAEEFKLNTGTFVAGGRLRADLVAQTSPVVVDAVICGEGYDEVGVLLWINPAGCAAELGIEGSVATLAAEQRVTDFIRQRIRDGRGADAGSAGRITRFAILTEAPDADAGEVSDKATINQSLTLKRRRADVENLYAGGTGVVLVD
ncbi:feruloyl-CoA synthase [Frankineae bacterium MT45]|nr:feruloyl-CoA synthase [Frankineae bacterium MT45]